MSGRRDVYIRTDGRNWEVEAQAGGDAGRSKVQQCPSKAAAEILAGAWLGGRPEWRELVPNGSAVLAPGQRRPAPRA